MMKKILIILSVALVLFSCGPGKQATQARKTFKGDWVLNSITYPNNSGEFNVTLFNDASAQCFNGSTWSFVSNNNTGTYTLQGPDCDNGQRYFVWSIDAQNSSMGIFDFLLKPTDSKWNSTTGNEGFRLSLVSLSGTSMVWEETVTLEGSPFVIRMNFTKL